MIRAVLALVATVAGLVFIFTFRPVAPTAEPLIVLVAPDGATELDPKKPGQIDDDPKFGEPKLVGAELGDADLGGGLDVAGLPDGTHTGSTVEILGDHGTVQVSVTIAGGRIVTVDAVHHPTSPRSAEISGQALPLLREAVLTTQDVPVGVVSGATAVSMAFRDSLLTVTG